MRVAAADPNPARALRTTLERFGEQQVRNRGLNDALLGSHSAGRAFAGQRREHAEAFAELVGRARSAGALREHITVQDARTALLAIASFRALPPTTATAAIRRLTDLLLAGLLSPRR